MNEAEKKILDKVGEGSLYLGWAVRRDAVVVECPGCGFAMGAEHESANARTGTDRFECPNCGEGEDDEPTPDRQPCRAFTTPEGIDLRAQVDPNLSEEARAALAAVAKAAYDQIRPMVDRAAAAVLDFERKVHAAAQAEVLASAPEQAAAAAREADAAREKVLEMAAKPVMVHARDASADAEGEISYLKETCLRFQKELEASRQQVSALSAQRADLERSCRSLRVEAEDLSRVLARAQEDPEEARRHEFPVFAENMTARIVGTAHDAWIDVPVRAGDSALVVAKALAVRAKHLRDL